MVSNVFGYQRTIIDVDGSYTAASEIINPPASSMTEEVRVGGEESTEISHVTIAPAFLAQCTIAA